MRKKQMQKENKRKKRVRRLMIFTTIISCGIFAGAHFIQPTEAMFTSSVTESGTIQTAFVFQETTEKLLDEAEQAYKQIDTIIPTNIEIKSIEEGESFKKQIMETDKNFQVMEENYKELNGYFERVQLLSESEQKMYDFVKNDYNAIEPLYDKLSEIEEKRENALQTIDSQIESLKQSSLESTSEQNINSNDK